MGFSSSRGEKISPRVILNPGFNDFLSFFFFFSPPINGYSILLSVIFFLDDSSSIIPLRSSLSIKILPRLNHIEQL